MKFPWPKEIYNPSEVWTACGQRASNFGAESREVQIFMRHWGDTAPSTEIELMERRERAYSALLNAVESATVPPYSQDKLDGLLDVLIPAGSDLQKDCIVCLTRFRNRQELDAHLRDGC